MKKRIISFVLAICLLVSMVPAMAVKSLAVSNVNYDEFQITFEQLFSSYPEYLSPKSEENITRNLSGDYTLAIKLHEGESVEIQKAMDALCNKGLTEFVLEGALSELGLGKDEEQELLWKTILLLMNNIFKDKTILAVICEKLGLSFDFVTTTIDLTKEAGKKAFIEHLKIQFSHLPPKDVEKVAEYIIKHKDKILKIIDDEKLSNANDTVGNMKKLCDIIQSMFLLYSLERESLDLLLNAVPSDSSFADAIRMVKKNMNKNLPQYVLDTYGHDAVVKAIITMLKLDPVLGSSLELADKIWNCVNITADVIRQEYLGYATYTDMKRTLILSGYVGDLRAAVVAERKDFVARVNAGSTIGLDEIEDYEFIYNAYMAAVRTAIASAKSLVGDDHAAGLDLSIDTCNKLTFDQYLRLCMGALRADIDANVVAPPSSLHGDSNACIVATYPASGTLTVTKENANIMDRPCSVNTDVNAQLIESGALNAEYTVTGSCVNTANNTWYIITTKSGQTGYIYSDNCTYVGASDATITGLDMPTTLSVGSRYWIKGTISANSSTILSVSCYVYDAAGNPVTGGKADVNGKTYVLDNSAIDTATEFNILGTGTYTWNITANVDVGNACQEVVLGSGTLVVGTQTEGGNSGNNVGGSILRAEGAEFISRSDGVWLWPLPASNYAINDWAGCTGNNPCYFHPNNIPGCIPAHDDEGRFGHNGIDLAAYYTDVYATASGYLYCTNTDWPSRGKTAIVEHPAGTDANGVSWSYYSIYQHLDSAETSRNGQWVEAGMRIAVSGATDGYGTGAFHLHFGIVMGQSGQGSSFAQNPNGALYNLENQGWLTTPGYGNGRILCNPALNSPAGTPAYNYGCEATTRGHAGSVLYTLNKSEVAIGEASSRPCSHNYTESVTKAATCTTDGILTKTCTLCNDTITETIPALGHDYQEKLVEATCGSYGYTLRTCSRCDFIEALEPSEEHWSEWSAEKPENMPKELIRPRTEYKEMTTSAETSLEGWTKAGAASWTEYGDWSDWGITPITGSATTEVETATVWGYYYLLCPNCGAHMHGYGTCWTWADGCGAPTYNTGWREIWSPISWDSANLREFRGTGKYWTDTIDGNRVFQWTDNGHATTGYRSRTKTEVQGFNYYRWTENEIEGAETRTVYSYYTGNLADHSWDNGAITKEPTENTEGEKTFTCTVCGATKKEAIPAKGGTEPSTPSCTNGHGYEERITQKPTKTSSGTLSYICIDCGHVETVELPPLTEDSKYQKEVIAPSCTEKGYTIYRWSPVVYIESDFTDATGHTWNGGVVTKEPTASSEGVKTYTCTVCSEVKTESIPRKDHIHNFVNGTCLLCGAVDPNWDYTDLITPIAYRKAGANRFDTAFLVADTMKAQLGVAKFDAVIVASGVSFADALSGSYLAAVKNAPILLSFNDKYNNMAKDYIRENLAPGGTVYILGGTSAVPASMETGLDGFKVKRLAGKDRFGTNLEILKEAGVEDKPILVCTGLSFADSLSASAAEMPILLVWNKLTKDQKTFLENAGDEFYIIGGESAVSCQMEEQLRDYGYVERIGGKNRFETSVRIAEEFFDNPDAVVLAYAWNFPDGLCGGALAAAMDAPLILTMDKYESQAAKYVFGKTLPRRFVLGSGELISDDAIRTIFGPATDIR